MGNLIIPKYYRDLWLKESREASNLLKITPINEQENQLIEAVKKDAAIMNLMGLLLGGTFSASLKRYFPEAYLTQNKFAYGITCLSIIVPIMTVVGIQCNHDVVERLKVIKMNHEILRDN
jgi:hypothetical protein